MGKRRQGPCWAIDILLHLRREWKTKHGLERATVKGQELSKGQ
jgi:hypothetical protein